MKREEIKIELSKVIKDLKAYASDFEDLLNEMDGLSDEEFNKRSDEIQELYSESGIELF